MTERRTLLGAAALGLAAVEAPRGAAAQSREGPLSGRAAVVTGAARGIGRATALELARQGADIALLDIARPDAIPELAYPLASAAELEAATRQVAATGARALALAADIRDRAATGAALDRAAEAFGGFDILVANAAIAIDGPVAGMTAQAWQALFDVNVTGSWHSVQAALPGMRRRGGGRIVLITSIQARGGSDQSGAYAASKWALTGLMKSLALELGSENIAVNAVAPTAVETVMMTRGHPTGPAPADRREAAKRPSHQLPRPPLQPEDIAAAITFLCGPAAASISGVTLDVNAGQSARIFA